MYILQRLKKVKFSLYTKCAVVIIALAMLLRIVLTALGWPVTNSDESTMGLMAVHIASLKDFPIFIWGRTIWAHLKRILVQCCFMSLVFQSLRCDSVPCWSLPFSLYVCISWQACSIQKYGAGNTAFAKRRISHDGIHRTHGSWWLPRNSMLWHSSISSCLLACILLRSRSLSTLAEARMLAFGCWGLVVGASASGVTTFSIDYLDVRVTVSTILPA